jgi:hypothetical protein
MPHDPPPPHTHTKQCAHAATYVAPHTHTHTHTPLRRASAGPAELAVLFNKLGSVCEPRAMSVKGLNTAKVCAAAVCLMCLCTVV